MCYIAELRGCMPDIDEDRRRKSTGEKFRREIQVLLTDQMYLEVLEASRGKKVSEWVREAVAEKLKRLADVTNEQDTGQTSVG